MAPVSVEEQKPKRTRERKKRPDGSLYSSDPSERMKQLQEDGKVGPQFGQLGGRPRKPRMSEAYAQVAEENMRWVKKALVDGLNPSKSSIHQRIRTVELLRKEEDKERERQEREAEREARGGREGLMNRMMELLLGDTPAAEEFRGRLAAMDVESEEIEDAEALPAA